MRQAMPAKMFPLPAGLECEHALARWGTKPARQPSRYPDGRVRTGHVGGRLVRLVARCARRPGHHVGAGATPHRTGDGREWS